MLKQILFFLFTFSLFSNPISKNFWIEHTDERFYYFIPEINGSEILFTKNTDEIIFKIGIAICILFNLSIILGMIFIFKKNYSKLIKFSIFCFLFSLLLTTPIIYFSANLYPQKISLDRNRNSIELVSNEKIKLPFSSLNKIFVQKKMSKSKKSDNKTERIIFYKIFIEAREIGEIEIFTTKNESIVKEIAIELAKKLDIDLLIYGKKEYSQIERLEKKFELKFEPKNLSFKEENQVKILNLSSLENFFLIRNLLISFLFFLISISILIPAFKNDVKPMKYFGGFFLIFSIGFGSSNHLLKNFSIQIEKNLIKLDSSFPSSFHHQIQLDTIHSYFYTEDKLVFILKGGEEFQNPEFERMNLQTLDGSLNYIQTYFNYVREFPLTGLSYMDRIFLYNEISKMLSKN